jgi:alpha-ketoglutarate-dependent taurine dioxygenase
LPDSSDKTYDKFYGFTIRPIEQASFGITLEFDTTDIQQALQILKKNQIIILDQFHAAHGLMVVKGMQQMVDQPSALVVFSKAFGSEVENYHQTLTSKRFFHDSVPEILILGNRPPCNHPPPAKTANQQNGELLVQFPHQKNWHTDQSYRRPPPDVTLLLAITLPPKNQGQTLFADCTTALTALDKETRQKIKELKGIHAPSWVGRSRNAVRNGEKVLDLLPHQLPQRHPLVRRHPRTEALSLYICEENQLDYIDGPIDGLEAGAEGSGADLIHRLLCHTTQSQFTYSHEWEAGDLLISDNRNLLHCATWYDAERYTRLMWRTTVMGDPGNEYRGEDKSWIPGDNISVMSGMEHA